MTHSPEPWRRGHSTTDGDIIWDANTSFVCAPIEEEDQKRIVACVNFLQGIPTDLLNLLLQDEFHHADVIADIRRDAEIAERHQKDIGNR